MQHNNYITIAKALGITLMVIGHSGCPQWLFRFIYLFHMPLFFFCSGIFYREMQTISAVGNNLKKRIKGLYVPVVKWSVFFLLIHNLLYYLGIYNSSYGYEGGTTLYTFSDMVGKLCEILFTMNGYEELLGGFWFIRSLFIAYMLIGLVSILLRRSFKYKFASICALFLCATILIRRLVPDIPFWREISMGCFGAMFYMLGYLLMPLARLWQNKYAAIFCCLILLFFFYFFNTGISMGCGYNKVIPFSLSAISGTLLIIYVSEEIELRFPLIKNVFYYIGNHTLEILALHFLSFRLVSFLLCCINGIDIVHVAEHPVIKDIDNLSTYWWAIYSIAGIAIPLLLNKIWQLTVCRTLKIIK